MPEIDEKPTTNLLNDENREAYVKNTPPKKPHPIVKLLGNIGLVSAATVSGIGAGGALTQGSPVEPFKDGFNASRELVDKVIPKDNKEEGQDTSPTDIDPIKVPEGLIPTDQDKDPDPKSDTDKQPAAEFQGGIGEEVPSSEPDLTELKTIFDTFVEDLKQIPAAKIGPPNSEIEMYKVAIGEKTIKFTREPNEKDPDKDLIKVEVIKDGLTKTFKIILNEITVEQIGVEPKTDEPTPAIVRSAGEMLTEELKDLHQEWMIQRNANKENLTSSIATKPSENQQVSELTNTPTPEPTATNTASPTPRATQPPYIPDLGPLDGGIEEASIKPSLDQPIEIQNPQPVATDSTTPKSDL